MTLTVRLTPELERALNLLAKRQGLTRSDLVREAIKHYTGSNARRTAEPSAYAQWSDVIGVVRVGARDGTKTTREQFAGVVARKGRDRRPR